MLMSSIVLHHDLEIRCPERGRKQESNLRYTVWLFVFGNKMPREGMETLILKYSLEIFSPFQFGNKMPREGTETFSRRYKDNRANLEIRNPVRGRNFIVTKR